MKMRVKGLVPRSLLTTCMAAGSTQSQTWAKFMPWHPFVNLVSFIHPLYFSLFNFNLSCFLGGVKMLIDMLGDSSTVCQFHALNALSNMALADQENQESILYHGGIDKIGNLLQSKCPDLQEQAVSCLGNMSATLPVHLTDTWSRILHNIKLLLEPSSPSRLQAVRTVAAFSQHIPFRESLIMHGTSKPLLQLATEVLTTDVTCPYTHS